MADPNPNPLQPPNNEDRDDTDDEDMDLDTEDEDFELAMENVDAMPAAPPPPQLPAQVTRHRAMIGAYAVRGLMSHFSLNEMVMSMGRRFVENFRVLSVRHLYNRDFQSLERGGKGNHFSSDVIGQDSLTSIDFLIGVIKAVIGLVTLLVFLPPSALERLSQYSSAMLSPMMFKVTNPQTQKITHCGVLEFTAEENICYMPTWMMEILGVSDNATIRIERAELPIATFAKFQPQSVDFLDISNPKAILESCLRFFACLTKGDIVAIHYNNHVYRLLVLELLPSNAVSIIECDMNVDFAPPVGYVSPSASRETVDDATAGEAAGPSTFTAFMGSGNRLNGKAATAGPVGATTVRAVRGQPDTAWRLGTLEFTRKFRKMENNKVNDDEASRFRAFEGTGRSLRK